MFSCNNPVAGFGELFLGCKQGPTKIKKVGQYIYHYDYQIGSGTYSQVYEGVSLQTDKAVAIKVIDLQLIKQRRLISLLYQQTQLMSELNHPNIIKCHALLKSENRCYIITQLCKKDNLEVLIEKAKNNRLPSAQIQRIIYDIYEGLLYLAQKTIIHRDLKTANILFSNNGKAKIADFGFATLGLNEFKDNVFVGTPLYMSPQAILEQKYSAKTDIWSFGIIIYELIFGSAPLSKCKDQQQLLQRILKRIEIPPNENISKDLQALLEGCLEQNSIYRWNIDKVSKSAYVQSLKKKYKIQSDIFQPLKLQSHDSHSSNKTTGTTLTTTQKMQKKQNSLQYLSAVPIKSHLKSKTQSGDSRKSPQKSKLTIQTQSKSPTVIHSPVIYKNQRDSNQIMNLNANFRGQYMKSPNSTEITSKNIQSNINYNQRSDISKAPINIQNCKSSQNLKFQLKQNHHSAITYSQPSNVADFYNSSNGNKYVKPHSDVRMERQSFGGTFQKYSSYQKIQNNYTSVQSNPSTNTVNYIKYTTQMPNSSVNFSPKVEQIRVHRQISWNEQQNCINQARKSELPLQLMHKASYQQSNQKQFYSSKQNPRHSEMPLLHLSSANAKNSKPQQVTGQSFFLNKQLTYKQAVSVVHYCRLLHKILQFPRYYHKNLHEWLLFLIKDLKQNAQVNSLKQAHTVSLKNVLQGYYSQYINQHNIEKARTGSVGEKTPQIKSILKIIKNLEDVDEKNKDKSLQKELLHNLLKQTQNLEQCLLNKEGNFQKYARQTKCQLYLDWFNNKDSKSQIQVTNKKL